jgi:glycine cleavage system H protein
MSKVRMGEWEFPDELLYDDHDQWIRYQDGSITFGLTPYGLEVTGDVLYLALPEQGTLVRCGEGCGSLEAGKWVGRIYAPAGGKVSAVNEMAAKRPGMISADPYGTWFMKIDLENTADLLHLMKSGEMANRLAEELKQHA